jgi:cytochrome c oxidase subunit I+III
VDVAPERVEQFERTWAQPRGFWGALSVVNNQPIGVRFMVTSLVFFAIGGIMALLMRIQLAVPENTFLDPQLFNELFTMHGSTMMFLFAVPFLEGLALYLIPLMIGSRDVAFPRLTAFSYWAFLFGGIIFYVSFLFGAAPDGGWFAYTPLTGPRFAGIELDFWLLGLAMVEVAGIGAGIEIVVTILKFRAPGMALNRMPLFAWAMLATGFMIIVAFTVLLTATILLELDRAVGTQFFVPEHGGSSLLWQHLFWFFGHPDVYIMFIPATGVVSMVVPVFARRPIAAYVLIVVAIVIMAFLSFGLWVHHMYATGLPTLPMNFFAAASLMIAIASGIQVFAWIATMWRRPLVYRAPMLYVLGFLFIFVIGGLTGVMIAIVPFDWQVHDTYFIVAHFHYVLIGGVVFPIFAGLHYWIPKFTGRMLGEGLSKWGFWLIFIGFNVTFFPMHIMGFLGLPRRVYTYPHELQIAGYNFAATVGAFVVALGVLLFFVNVFYSRAWGRAAGANPWNGDSLEWSVSSPPPRYSFLKPPTVRAIHELWSERPLQESEASARAREALAAAPLEWRATLVTDALTARPQAIQFLPGSTHIPLHAALALLLASAGVLMQAYILAAFGMALAAGVVIRWLWPGEKQLALLQSSTIGHEAGVPIFATGSRSAPWWGMVMLLACVGSGAAALIYSYFFLRLFSEQWPQDDLPLPELMWPAIGYGLLAAGSGAMGWASYAFAQWNRGGVHAGLAGSLVCGAGFVGIQCYLLANAGFLPQANAYASIFHVINWMMTLLVLIAIALIVAGHARITREGVDRNGYAPLHLQLTSLWWHVSVVIGVIVFFTLHVSPHTL